jgi:hypothetical protein
MRETISGAAPRLPIATLARSGRIDQGYMYAI